MKLTAETRIRGDLEAVWRLTHTPDLHARWDLRFTDIEYLPKECPEGPQRFRYATRIGFGVAIEGWGETVGERDGRGSALRFGSDDAKSLIREGAGFWAYEEDPRGIHFSTVYDYRVRYGALGRLVDRVIFRPLMVWATRWSFDRLRIWIEEGIAPEVSLRLWLAKVSARTALGLVWVVEGLVPKLLFVSPDEIDLVRRVGLAWPDARVALGGLGVAEILAGVWLISGRAERPAAVVTTVALVVLSGMAVALDPAALAHPYGGLPKDLGLLACAGVVWILAAIAPKAGRAAGRWGKKP